MSELEEQAPWHSGERGNLIKTVLGLVMVGIKVSMI
jgi:hypothetical protein